MGFSVLLNVKINKKTTQKINTTLLIIIYFILFLDPGFAIKVRLSLKAAMGDNAVSITKF